MTEKTKGSQGNKGMNATSSSGESADRNAKASGRRDEGDSKRKQDRMPSDSETPDEVQESDDVYNLTSVLYHALQGVETCSMYAADAEDTDNTALSEFFQECCAQQDSIAERAKALLFQVLSEREQGQGAGKGRMGRGEGSSRFSDDEGQREQGAGFPR